MIATLNFERSDLRGLGTPDLEPGLHRIDEILGAWLARYESQAFRSPEMSIDRFADDQPDSDDLCLAALTRSRPR